MRPGAVVSADCSTGVVIMPNRYQREIEEILSRMEESEPQQRGPGDRIRPLRRPAPRTPRSSLPSVHIALSPLLLLVSVALTLIATGWAFYNGAPDLITGAIGAGALLIFIVGLFVGWRGQFRPQRTSQWRGTGPSSVAGPTPIRRNPISALITRFRVYRLRQQYRRAQQQNDDK